jgi:hypothetical protein
MVMQFNDPNPEILKPKPFRSVILKEIGVQQTLRIGFGMYLLDPLDGSRLFPDHPYYSSGPIWQGQHIGKAFQIHDYQALLK